MIPEEIYKKLKLNKFTHISLLQDAQEGSIFSSLSHATEATDLQIAYVYTLENMKEIIFSVFKKQLLLPNGQLFIFYPKTKNKLGYVAIGRDSIFPFLQVDETGYVTGTRMKFNRMVSLDDNYTMVSLKFTDTIETTPSSKNSQKVADYEHHIKDIKSYLSAFPQQFNAYEQLTPGYQRGWARYIYSAKTNPTQEKRKQEMVEILKAGYKSKELFQAAQRSAD